MMSKRNPFTAWRAAILRRLSRKRFVPVAPVEITDSGHVVYNYGDIQNAIASYIQTREAEGWTSEGYTSDYGDDDDDDDWQSHNDD